MSFPGGSDCKESTCNAGDMGLIPGLGRSPGGGHGNPLQYSCLENPMDRGAWWATANGSQRVRHDWATKRSMLGNYKFRHDIHDSYQVKGSKYTHEQISPMLVYANTTGSWSNYYCKNKLATQNRNLKFSSLKCFKHFFFFGFPGGASGKEPTCQCRRHKRHGFDPWVRKSLWKWAWQPTPAHSNPHLPEESHGQRNLVGYSP